MEQITKQHPNSGSADLVRDNIEQLAQLFPEVIKEGKVDFEALHDLLGEYGDTAEERFCLNWAGKAQARREAQKRSTGTLRPCKEDSVNWDTTENLYIEGDNLEVLKLLQKSYHKQVKMIYIDPPYNTGKDFVYKDNYKDNMANYLELTSQDRKMSTKALSDSDGRYHSNWLNMMYPRLKLARNLLTDDGVIFISIDDNEVDNLKKICNEIFGEENFVAQMIWEQGRKSIAIQVAVNHEYCLIYCKNKQNNIAFDKINENKNWRERKKGLEDIYAEYERLVSLHDDNYPSIEKGIRLFYKNLDDGNPAKCHMHYKCVDESGLYFPGDISQGTGNGGRFDILHPVTNKPCKVPNGGWRFGESKLPELLKKNKIHFGVDETIVPCLKRHLKETEYEVVASVFYKDGRGASKRIEQLLERKVFDFPKDENVIKNFISLVTSYSHTHNSIILDFFSGSATTAHALMQLNAEDNGNRKYICVQIPEATPDDSEARKIGYDTIPEVAKERIRRAGNKIIEEQNAKSEGGLFAEETTKIDTGFKVFKLDSSNIYSWDSSPENLEQSLNNSLFNIKEDRTEDDLLYEILIKYGVELSVKINRHTIAGKTVYEMGAGSLIVCLADNLTKEVAEGIAALYKSVSPEGEHLPCRVVFKESGFNGSDEVKSNTMLILKQHGITNVASV